MSELILHRNYIILLTCLALAGSGCGKGSANSGTDQTPIGDFLSHDQVNAAIDNKDADPPPPSQDEVDATAKDLPTSEEMFLGIKPIKNDLTKKDDSKSDTTRTFRSLDLRRYDTPIRNQGSRGWCTAFAMIAAMENVFTQSFNHGIDLSEIHLWRTYATPATSMAVNAAEKNFIVSEKTWPYSEEHSLSEVSGKGLVRLNEATPLQDMTLSSVVDSVFRGKPLVLGFAVNKSFFGAANNRGILRSSASLTDSGHAVAVVGAVADPNSSSGGYFIFKNSHGSSWGDQGYGYLPFDYCVGSQYCYAWSVASVEVTGKGVVTPKPDWGPGNGGSQPVVNTSALYKVSLHFDPSQDQGIYRYFYLNMDADTAALAAIDHVIYHTHPTFGKYAHLTVKDPIGGFQSRTVGTYSNGWTTRGTTLYLKNGQRIELTGSKVAW